MLKHLQNSKVLPIFAMEIFKTNCKRLKHNLTTELWLQVIGNFFYSFSIRMTKTNCMKIHTIICIFFMNSLIVSIICLNPAVHKKESLRVYDNLFFALPIEDCYLDHSDLTTCMSVEGQKNASKLYNFYFIDLWQGRNKDWK